MVPSAREIPAGHQPDDVPAELVGPGDPAGAVDHPRVDEIANIVVPQRLRSDITLDQKRVLGEVVVAEQRVFGRFQRRAQPLVVDLAVARQPDRQQLPVPAGLADLDQDVFQRVGGRDGAAQVGRVGPVHQGGDRRGVTGVVDHRLGQPGNDFRGPRLRAGGDDGLDVGRVARLQAAHEGVLTDRTFGQELLGGAAAHRPRHRRDDDVAHLEPLEDALIGLPMRVVGGLEPGVVDVEGVGVLHHELADAQDARARPCLVAVFVLDLEQQQREVLVGAVFALDGQGEQLFVRRAQQVVVAAAVLEPKHAVAVLGPAVRRLVRRTRQQGGEQDLLPADRVHLLAHHAFDVAQHPQPQRQPAVQPGCDGPDVSGPDQKFVAGHLGVGGVIAQGAQEQLGHPGDHSAQA